MKGLLAVLRRRWRLVLGILVALAVVLLAYGYVHTRDELNRLSNPKTASQAETQKLTHKIGKLIELPTGETPTLATVSDASKLKTQEFFSRAENGDKVLIYSQAGRAVLYRPSTNKVIEYSKVNLSSAGK